MHVPLFVILHHATDLWHSKNTFLSKYNNFIGVCLLPNYPQQVTKPIPEKIESFGTWPNSSEGYNTRRSTDVGLIHLYFITVDNYIFFRSKSMQINLIPDVIKAFCEVKLMVEDAGTKIT